MVNVNQMIAFMPLMNIHFPPNTILLFKLLAIFNGDVAILQKAYDFTIGTFLPFPEDSPPFNERF